MPETRTSLAVVLRWRPYGESDKIATLLTEDFGKLTGIAKGARRSRRRFPNSLEPLAGVRLHFHQRPHASLAFLESCDLLRPVANLIEMPKFAYASYLVELIDQLTGEEHPVRELYTLLEEGLAALQQGPATDGFLRGFEVQLLTHAGYEPRVDVCNGCRARLIPASATYLGLTHGNFWCERCRSQAGAVVEVSGQALPFIEELKRLPLDVCRRQAVAPEGAAMAEVTGRLLSFHLPRPLRSIKLIAQIGAEPRDAAAS